MDKWIRSWWLFFFLNNEKNAKKQRWSLWFFLNIVIGITDVLVLLCVKLHSWCCINTFITFIWMASPLEKGLCTPFILVDICVVLCGTSSDCFCDFLHLRNESLFPIRDSFFQPAGFDRLSCSMYMHIIVYKHIYAYMLHVYKYICLYMFITISNVRIFYRSFHA